MKLTTINTITQLLLIAAKLWGKITAPWYVVLLPWELQLCVVLLALIVLGINYYIEYPGTPEQKVAAACRQMAAAIRERNK